MSHPDHFHAHPPAADDHRGRRAEFMSVVEAHQSEGLTPPGYATRGIATLDALIGPGEDSLD